MNDWFAARRQRMLRLKVRREGEPPDIMLRSRPFRAASLFLYTITLLLY